MPTISAEPAAGSSALRRDAEVFSDALGGLIRVVQFRDRDRACCHGLSVSQCYALKAVIDSGAMTVNDLAAELYLDKSTASRVANGLVAKGLLERHPSEEDRRVIRLEATDEGAAVGGRIEADLASEYADLLADFDPEVREGMIRLMGRLARSFAARVDTSGGSCCVVG